MLWGSEEEIDCGFDDIWGPEASAAVEAYIDENSIYW